jgi:signal transduction histidine kinase
MFEKDLVHKNLTMDFSIPKNELLDVYIKIRNNKSFQYGFAFRETKEYFSTSVREYFFMGLFYGAILMITLYQLTFFFSLKDFAYIFYVLYILIQGLYLCFRDASALVFLFPNTPWLIESAYGIVMCGLSISVLLYSRFFLQLINYKWFNYIIVGFVLIRVPFLFVFPNYPIGLMWFDFSAVAISFILSIESLVQRQRTALLFCISFGVIIIGNFINVLWHSNIISCTDDIFYSLYYAVGLESLLLAIANAYRLSSLREFALMKTVLEKKVTQNMETIRQQEQMIQEKSDELDVFLYRASHDIKGPLKSIEGLSKVGLMDNKDKNQYFNQIAKTSIALQKILNALLQIAKQNRAELKFEPTHVLLLVEECFTEQLVEYPGLNEMTFKLEIPADAIILAEKYLLLSVVQNLIENAIKYRDPEKSEHLLTIKYEQSVGVKSLEFRDNGLGVNEESLKKLFQMFFRANTQSGEGAGLGLYIVKQNVERLKGKISIESKEKEFTSIRLDFSE